MIFPKIAKIRTKVISGFVIRSQKALKNSIRYLLEDCMVCMDLFVAALAIGLGFRFAQYAMGLLTEFIEAPLSELKKPRSVALGVVLLLLFIYLSNLLMTWQLF